MKISLVVINMIFFSLFSYILNFLIILMMEKIHLPLQSNPQLYLALVDLAYTAPLFNERDVIEALNEVLESDQLSDEDKLRFSQRKLDFLEDLGTDVEALVSIFLFFTYI